MVTRGRGLVGLLDQVGALHPVLRVLQGVEVAGGEGGDRLGADHHPGVLDDHEHLPDALVHVAQQPALGRYAVLAEGQLAGVGDLQAHLVLDVGGVDAVALAQLAGGLVEVELRHDEQRQALGAGAADALHADRAGQHVVDDVVGQVVLTAR